MSARLRLWRRVRLAPGLTLNIGSHGVSSFSVGRRGAHLTFGRRGMRTTVGLPGSGISYTVAEPYRRRSGRPRTSLLMYLICAVIVLIAIAVLSH